MESSKPDITQPKKVAHPQEMADGDMVSGLQRAVQMVQNAYDLAKKDVERNLGYLQKDQ
jgi:hypothetical protein